MTLKTAPRLTRKSREERPCANSACSRVTLMRPDQRFCCPACRAASYQDALDLELRTLREEVVRLRLDNANLRSLLSTEAEAEGYTLKTYRLPT